MKGLFVSILILICSFSTAQKEIAFSDVQRKEINHASGSAFMQYSNFQPGNLLELLMAVSGNKRVEALLIESDTDTLPKSALNIFNRYLRKDFGMESIHSPTTVYFAKNKIYSPDAMKSFIVISYSYYLKEESIRYSKVRRQALKGNRFANQKARRELTRQSRSYRKNR